MRPTYALLVDYNNCYRAHTHTTQKRSSENTAFRWYSFRLLHEHRTNNNKKTKKATESTKRRLNCCCWRGLLHLIGVSVVHLFRTRVPRILCVRFFCCCWCFDIVSSSSPSSSKSSLKFVYYIVGVFTVLFVFLVYGYYTIYPECVVCAGALNSRE